MFNRLELVKVIILYQIKKQSTPLKGSFQGDFGKCRERSSKRRAHQLTHELNPGTGRLLTPSPVLGLWVLHAVPALRGCSRS